MSNKSSIGRRLQPRVAVVGAGIVGSCIAHMLQKRGAAVTLIDRCDPGMECSYGNLGAISEGSVAPLAMPGVLGTVPAMLVDKESPLRLPLGNLLQSMPWLLRFWLSSSVENVEETATKLAGIHAGATNLHEELTRELGVPELFLRNGHLHLYPDAEALAKDDRSWALRRAHGVKFERIDRATIQTLEPQISDRYRIGMFMEGHATIRNPLRYVQAMVRSFASNGGTLRKDEVSFLSPLPGRRWQLQTVHGPQKSHDVFDDIVIAAGAWSKQLLRPLGISPCLETQRGYHVQFHGAGNVVSRTVVLADRKIFVAPMEDGLRVGGTVEFGGLQARANMRRAEVLERIARKTFDGLDDARSDHWMGHRPCMPDSVPVIGPAFGHPGLWLAIGHGHLGLTDSVMTAIRISDGVLA